MDIPAWVSGTLPTSTRRLLASAGALSTKSSPGRAAARALVLTACGSSATNGENPVKAAGVLRVGTEGTYAPFSYHDPATGELAGYDVDVARAVGDKLGVKVEFVETPWDSIFAALEANRFDVVANQVTITAERQAKYDLSEPYAIGEGVIVTRADDNSITSLGGPQGQDDRPVDDQQLGAGRPRRRRQGRGGRGLRPGDHAAQPGPRRRHRQRQHRRLRLPGRDRRHRVKIAAKTGEKSEQGFAARKDSGLLPDLNKALDELKNDGTLARSRTSTSRPT